MVVHMVTLVTMAMVTVAPPAPYKPHHLVVLPPEETIEDLRDISNAQPTTLEEKPVVESVAFDSAANRKIDARRGQ